MKPERFKVTGLLVERQFDRWNGEFFIAWKPHVSQGFRDRKTLLKFIAWPVKTPTGDALREWLKGFDAEPEPAPACEGGISPEVAATGFGPECHLDKSDPNHNTRTVI